ncbi:MAG: 4Fe-4S binding protein [Paludibacteraceae bacterium]
MNSFVKYISGIFTAVKSLAGGLMVTWKELWTKKVTMQYPENRESLVISDRWRSELYMPHDENNEHACTACGICMTNCPNGTITVTTELIENEEGRKKKVLDKHIWDYGMCTFCNLCVITCPSDAIFFNNDFEGAMFDRSKLVHQLNQPGSKLREKKKKDAPPKVEKNEAEASSTVQEKSDDNA